MSDPSTTTAPTTIDLQSLPWDALDQQEPIPWDELRALAAAVASHADDQIVEDLFERYDRAIDVSGGSQGFACVYIPAVVAMAGPDASAPRRHLLADRALDRLNADAWDSADVACEEWSRLARPLRPEICVLAADRLKEETGGKGPWFYLWNFIEAAVDTDDAELHTLARDTARLALDRALDGEIDPRVAFPAAHVLAMLKDTDSRPLVAQVSDFIKQGPNTILGGLADLDEALAILDGERDPYPPLEFLAEPIETWLTKSWEFQHSWINDPPRTTEDDQAWDLPRFDQPFDIDRWTDPVEVVMPIERDTPRVGRNDPCPCGSGKKYKRCCGR